MLAVGSFMHLKIDSEGLPKVRQETIDSALKWHHAIVVVHPLFHRHPRLRRFTVDIGSRLQPTRIV